MEQEDLPYELVLRSSSLNRKTAPLGPVYPSPGVVESVKLLSAILSLLGVFVKKNLLHIGPPESLQHTM